MLTIWARNGSLGQAGGGREKRAGERGAVGESGRAERQDRGDSARQEGSRTDLERAMCACGWLCGDGLKRGFRKRSAGVDTRAVA
jgi:hypothetical protein